MEASPGRAIAYRAEFTSTCSEPCSSPCSRRSCGRRECLLRSPGTLEHAVAGADAANDPVFVEAAQALGCRVAAESHGDARRESATAPVVPGTGTGSFRDRRTVRENGLGEQGTLCRQILPALERVIGSHARRTRRAEVCQSTVPALANPAAQSPLLANNFSSTAVSERIRFPCQAQLVQVADSAPWHHHGSRAAPGSQSLRRLDENRIV